jgi:hypothetical protein
VMTLQSQGRLEGPKRAMSGDIVDGTSKTLES